jgi:antitoxin component of RelBE/YafQ-DinJ toxin-antitoxin module
MQTQDVAREKQINFRVSEAEAERFERVALHLGIPVAAMIRMLVKREDDAIEARAPQALGLLHTRPKPRRK